MDREKTIEQTLNVFFSGLESGLQSLREIRSVYDEEVAFDFDPLRLFKINENTVSEMLAYFLDPQAKHGQKDRLLKVFLTLLLGEEKTRQLLNPETVVQVSTQYFTEQRRPIDAVITFGACAFMIGIENKVFDAVDQKGQVRDYVVDLKKKSGDNFLMLYLSPNGDDPETDSIDSEDLKVLKEAGKFKTVTFRGGGCDCSVLSILSDMAAEAKADTVRVFLKLMKRYFEMRFGGGTTVGEQNFVSDYVRRNPEILEHRYVLDTACESLRNEFIEALLKELKGKLVADFKKDAKSALFYLPGAPEWRGYPVPIVAQVEFVEDGILRVGILSNDNSLNTLADAYLNKPIIAHADYQRSGCWTGGFFVAQQQFIKASDVAHYFRHKELPSFQVALEQVCEYRERIKEICKL